MNRFLPLACALAQIIGLLSDVALLAALPARAEENRLLPFWAQPYPAGYVQPVEPCTVFRRVPTRRGVRLIAVDQCRPVLRAKG